MSGETLHVTNAGLHLLVVDSPNIDRSLGTIVGHRPLASERLRFDALGKWFADRAGGPDRAEACYFINVLQERAAEIRSWVYALREAGFFVFAKPKIGDSDIDDDMLDHIRRRHAETGLAEVAVASGDRRNFEMELDSLSEQGVRVNVVGFAEMAPWALTAPNVTFVDLRDIPNLFLTELPRQPVLERLPAEGAWFKPLAPLGRSVLPRDNAEVPADPLASEGPGVGS